MYVKKTTAGLATSQWDDIIRTGLREEEKFGGILVNVFPVTLKSNQSNSTRVLQLLKLEGQCSTSQTLYLFVVVFMNVH